MFPAIQFGRLFGIPLQVRVSFLVMLAAVLLFMGGLAGVFVVLLAFGSIILHELGHALTARKLGISVSAIELHFFGGVARLTRQPSSARDEALIAAAGPAVSFALAGLGYTLYAITGFGGFALFGVVNLIIALFNLLPALPMDGGRIFRALLSKRVGFQRATEISVKVSRAVSITFGVFGLAFMQIQLLLLAFVLWSMASAERANAGRSPYGPQPGHFGPTVVPHRGPEPGARQERIIVLRYNQRRN